MGAGFRRVGFAGEVGEDDGGEPTAAIVGGREPRRRRPGEVNPGTISWRRKGPRWAERKEAGVSFSLLFLVSFPTLGEGV